MLYQCRVLFPLYSNCIPIITISHHVDLGDLGPFGVWFMALLYPHYLPMISPCCIPILIQNYIPILYSHDIAILHSHYTHSITSHSENWPRSATAPPPLAQVPDPHAVVVAGSGKHGATRVEIHRHDLEEFPLWFP